MVKPDRMNRCVCFYHGHVRYSIVLHTLIYMNTDENHIIDCNWPFFFVLFFLTSAESYWWWWLPIIIHFLFSVILWSRIVDFILSNETLDRLKNRGKNKINIWFSNKNTKTVLMIYLSLLLNAIIVWRGPILHVDHHMARPSLVWTL
jgi:hypothetical protein